jgi:4a-hydroxytetrahydrobiopterin dehydratase
VTTVTESLERLDATQVREASLPDWRQILGRLKARFRTGDFATGLALVNKIGGAAEAAHHHPDVALTSSDVIVTLASHDVRGITSRDLDLAREISGHAAELGIDADVSGLTQLELGLDTAQGARLAPFYAALLGGQVDQGEPVDPSGQVPTVWWQEPNEADETWALPEQSFEQRWHFDVWVPHDEGERRLQAVLDAGGRLVSDRAAPAYWVVEDADGNRSCICTPAGR